MSPPQANYAKKWMIENIQCRTWKLQFFNYHETTETYVNIRFWKCSFNSFAFPFYVGFFVQDTHCYVYILPDIHFKFFYSNTHPFAVRQAQSGNGKQTGGRKRIGTLNLCKNYEIILNIICTFNRGNLLIAIQKYTFL